MTRTTRTPEQPVGTAVAGWTPRPAPPHSPMVGRRCTLEPLDASRHGDDLVRAFVDESEASHWTYLPYGPFRSRAEFRDWLARQQRSSDPLFFAVVDRASGRAVGFVSYLRIEPQAGVLEVGHINYSPHLRRTAVATEAIYLLLRRAFDELGYRRCEWKSDSLNAASRRAAARLGFSYEGVFRQHTVYKDRNRDTAWCAIVDGDWPRLRGGLEAWLDPSNFDAEGRQRRRLEELASSIR